MTNYRPLPFCLLLLAAAPTAAPAETLVAAPRSGASPLAVTFSSPDAIAHDFYRIDFGDGETSRTSSGFVNQPHTYGATGRYAARLQHAANVCARVRHPCTQPEPKFKTVATVKVVVGGHSNGRR